MSYYSSPKHKSLLHQYLVHFSDFHMLYLEHGLVSVIESFSPLNQDYTTSFVKVRNRSDMTSHAMPDTVYLPGALNWPKFVWTGYNLASLLGSSIVTDTVLLLN